MIEHVTASDQVIIEQYPGTAAIAPIAAAGSFSEMSTAVAAAQAELEAAADQPAEQQIPQLAEESNKAIHAASKTWLATQSKEELDAAAAAAGFPHPEMVSDKALSAWLDPSYPVDAPYKSVIAAKSVERYNAAVAASQIIPIPTAPDMPPGHWEASPAEVLAAQSAFLAAAADSANTQSPASLHALIDTENKLATAHCPELGAALEASKAQAKELVDAQVEKSYAANQVVLDAIASGALPEHADLLPKAQAVQLLRQSTPAQEQAALNQLISERAAILETKNAALEQLTELCGGHGYFKPKPFTSAADAIVYQHAAQAVLAVGQDDWKCVAGHYGLNPKLGKKLHPDTFAQGLRHGAKSLSMDQLRGAATAEGLKDTKGASRAELQNFLIAGWHPGLHPEEIAAGIASKKKKAPPAAAPNNTDPQVSSAAATATTAPAPSAMTPSNSSSSKPTGVGISPTAGSGKWLTKQQQTMAALKHQAASLADAPPRPPTAEVAAWQFTAGPSMHLGGAHTKHVVTAPDGSLWMFKPTKDDYRAVSESGANSILHRAGIPTVPVYARPHTGQNGTVQPLIKGATSFPSDPGHWSQSDVDAIVRYHAAAWLVGDHDAKHDNLLRTPKGGVVPCDHGQAFKFWGQDTLATDYHPNSSYGAQPPVWNVLYAAAKTGKLAPGVTVRPAAALPVIKAIESIPDAEFKAMLAPSATAGAASGSTSHWRPVFETRAAAKHGTPPTPQQVADEFVAYGVARKNGLRQAFTKFFSDAQIDSADVITKVA